MRRRKGPAGNAGQLVDLVEQGAVSRFGANMDVPHPAQYAESKRRRALAAARERDQHQGTFGAAAAVHVEQAVFGIAGGRMQRLVHRHNQRTAAAEQQRRDETKHLPFAHAPDRGC